jgi:hypothetical protein
MSSTFERCQVVRRIPLNLRTPLHCIDLCAEMNGWDIGEDTTAGKDRRVRYTNGRGNYVDIRLTRNKVGGWKLLGAKSDNHTGEQWESSTGIMTYMEYASSMCRACGYQTMMEDTAYGTCYDCSPVEE